MCTKAEAQKTPAGKAGKVFDEHLAVMLDVDLEPLKAGYSEDAVMRTPDGVRKGARGNRNRGCRSRPFFQTLGLRLERIEDLQGFVSMTGGGRSGIGTTFHCRSLLRIGDTIHTAFRVKMFEVLPGKIPERFISTMR